LHLDNDPETVARFLQLAATARGEPAPDGVTSSRPVRHEVAEALDEIQGMAPASPPSNLPLQLTSFIGREQEIADVRTFLNSARLVTLTGSGGVGKTRLSLRAAEEVLGEFPDGVCLVELAPLSEPALVAQQVASRLGLRDESGHPILDTLTAYLRERQALLVLDNCEHLLDACAWLNETKKVLRF